VKAVSGDCGGNDSGNHGTQPDLAACKEICRITSGCQYYVWWPDNNMCYPKHTCTTSTGHVDSAFAYELTCSEEEHCSVKAVVGDCGGNDSGNHGVQPNLAACKEICRNTNGCQYYVWWSGNSMCYPKHTCTTSTGHEGSAFAYKMTC